jgi:hypothetical protein
MCVLAVLVILADAHLEDHGFENVSVKRVVGVDIIVVIIVVVETITVVFMSRPSGWLSAALTTTAARNRRVPHTLPVSTTHTLE